MRRVLPFAFAAVALVGCTMGAAEQGPAAPKPGTGEPAACDADRATAYVGRPGDAIAEEARAAARARAVRVIRPNQAVTMDFRPDRLNIETDDGGIVLSLRCG
ncbi:I78 family peptidase inhibitor [Sphingomonadaceae bacterium G21617-S1]|nr:I78 family peptidase inhibitor [Sphingomonadaceae bacterium G21617-S1]